MTLSEKTIEKIRNEGGRESSLDEERELPIISNNGHEFVPKNGAYWVHDIKDAHGDRDFKLCSILKVVGQFKSDDKKSRGVIVDVYGDDDEPQRITLGMDVVTRPDRLAQTLANAGLQIFAASRQNCKGLISELILVYPRAGVETLRSATVNGWIEPGYCYVRPGGEVLGCLSNGTRVISLKIKSPDQSRGTLPEWQKEIAEGCLKSSRMIAALGVSLAGAILGLVDVSSRGLHFYGPSTTGKTIAALAAVSVWGSSKSLSKPGNGHFASWNSTVASVEFHFTRNNSSLSALDELHLAQRVVRGMGDVSLLFGNETPTGRGNADMTGRDQAGWRETLISTGEISISETLAKFGIEQSVGAERRVPGVYAIPPGGRDIFEPGYFPSFSESQVFVDHIRRVTESEQYGTAGPAYVGAIIAFCRANGIGALREKIKGYREQARRDWLPTISGNLTAGQQVNEVLISFEVFFAALKLGREFGVLPESYTDESIGGAIQSCAHSAMQEFRGSDWKMRSYAQKILDALIQKRGHFVVSSECPKTVAYPDDRLDVYGCLYRFGEAPDESEIAFILTDAFKNSIIPRCSAASIMRLFPAACFAGNDGPKGKDGDSEKRKWIYHSPKPYPGLEPNQRYLALKIKELQKLAR